MIVTAVDTDRLKERRMDRHTEKEVQGGQKVIIILTLTTYHGSILDCV